MAYFRNDAWIEDIALKNDLKKYVGQLFKREEILSFVQRDYPCYTWSIPWSLHRTLLHFEIVTMTGTYQLRTLGRLRQMNLMDLGNCWDTEPCRKRFVRSMNWMFRETWPMLLCMTASYVSLGSGRSRSSRRWCKGKATDRTFHYQRAELCLLRLWSWQVDGVSK